MLVLGVLLYVELVSQTILSKLFTVHFATYKTPNQDTLSIVFENLVGYFKKTSWELKLYPSFYFVDRNTSSISHILSQFTYYPLIEQGASSPDPHSHPLKFWPPTASIGLISKSLKKTGPLHKVHQCLSIF